MDVKAGYKQTEVGVIPDDWEVRTLDSLGKRGRPAIKAGPFGSSLTKDTYAIEGYKVYGQEQVIRGDYTYGDYFISRARFNELRSCAVEPGDILLSLVGTTGRVLVIPPGAPEGIINPRLIRFSFDQNVISPSYFRFLFESEAYQALLARSAQGGTMGVLNAGLLRPISIPRPPPAEQNAIAAALGDVDALITALDRLIAKKRDIKQAAMQELLTGKRRLPGFASEKGYKQTEVGVIPEDWDFKSIGSEIDLLVGFPFPSNQYVYAGIKLLRGSNIKRGVTEWSDDITKFWSQVTPDLKSYLLSEGDLVIAMDGSLVGRSYARLTREDIPALLLQRVARIRAQKIDVGYLTEFVGSDRFVKYCDSVKTVTAIPHISSHDIRNFSIPIPQRMEEQRAIAAILSDMDTEIAALEQKRDKTKALKQGMMQELLTGRIRLA